MPVGNVLYSTVCLLKEVLVPPREACVHPKEACVPPRMALIMDFFLQNNCDCILVCRVLLYHENYIYVLIRCIC